MRKLKNSELQRINVETFKSSKKTPLIIVLDNVRSLNNVGSIFRTSDAFLVEEILLCGITATPPHREIHKTALGAEDSVKWQYFENTLDAISYLKKNDYCTLAIEQADEATMLDELQLESHQNYAIILGNEVKGVRQDVVNACDGCIEIPQFGTKHSLNVSITGGIVIWDFYLKMNAPAASRRSIK